MTTDHLSHAGTVAPASPTGLPLQQQGVNVASFNSYGSKRGNHEVMLRSTLADIRIGTCDG